MPRKRQTTKSKIVKAAWNLFYKKGYHATTIDDIITASRTSKGSFYHYFKGKDALLGSLAYLFDDKYEELVASMDPTLSAADRDKRGYGTSDTTLLLAADDKRPTCTSR